MCFLSYRDLQENPMKAETKDYKSVQARTLYSETLLHTTPDQQSTSKYATNIQYTLEYVEKDIWLHRWTPKVHFKWGDDNKTMGQLYVCHQKGKAYGKE